ncbi:MAG: hypothetical protein M4579_005215 [Chaenotheca gracillima]|nr:MAG: hypothetical protein M4579_005215 [Chaenotheca gracillima]
MFLSSSQRRSFNNRLQGIFRKAFELQKRFRARVSIVIEFDSQYFVYRSSDTTNWPPPMNALQSRCAPNNYLPSDFQTARDAKRAGDMTTMHDSGNEDILLRAPGPATRSKPF